MSFRQFLLVGALPDSLVNFRGDLLKELTEISDDVYAVSSEPSDKTLNELSKMQVKHLSVDIRRHGVNPFKDLVLLISIYKIYLRIRPCAVLAYTIKPVIWGGVAARIAKVDFVAMITGLGFAFQGSGFFRSSLKKIVISMYKASLKNAKCVIFQNPDNAQLFMELGIVAPSKVRVVNGSGVNLSRFAYSPLPVLGWGERVVFTCVARLLREKGLFEYALAAEIVKKSYPQASIRLVGPLDLSPDGINLEQVETWKYVDYLGETSDVRPYIEASHVYVLPSYHEGLPRSTLEAMSMGRPVITTNAVGCKETVIDGWNGYKVDVADANQLAEKMIWCIENQDKLEQMGKNSRSLVEERFDVRVVNAEIMKALGVES